MTFKEIYESLETPPSPKEEWVKRMASITLASEFSVKMWISGRNEPSALAKKILSEELGRPVEELFPGKK
jgi:hypothetical protein